MRFDHFVCRGSLVTTYNIYIYIYIYIILSRINRKIELLKVSRLFDDLQVNVLLTKAFLDFLF